MKKSICFVGLDSYPVLNPRKGNEYFGGESVQQTLLAKAFVELGYDVTLISLDYGQPDEEIISGIKVLKTYRLGEGIPIIRFFYPKMSSILKALKKADSDIYYQSCAGALTGIVSWFCKKNNKKFIFRLAHDSDCIPGEQIIPNIRDLKLYEYGLKNTNLIAAQGTNQVELLESNYKLESTPVNMTVGLPEEKQCEKNIDILWVNNFRQFKRPELVIDLAKMLPQYNICMIGGPVPGNETLFNNVQEMSNEVDNLSVMGAIPYADVNNYFSRSKVFINTSDWEGFPNSFLQAWARGVPVISFFDPDDIIVNRNIGRSPSSLEDMSKVITDLLSDGDELLNISNNAIDFVLKNYSPLAIAKKYESLIS